MVNAFEQIEIDFESASNLSSAKKLEYKSKRKPRPSEAALGERKWLNEMLMSSMRGCSLSEVEIKDRLLAEVEQAIDELLPQVKDGQGIGIVFKLNIIDHTGRVEGSTRDLRHDDLAQEWKSSVLKRDRFACQKCRAKDNLQVHHIEEWATTPELRFDVNNGVTLCVDCHADQHPDIANFIRANGGKKRKRKTNKADTGKTA